VVGGLTGDVIAIALITVGLGAVALLMFLEVGLSDERQLAREDKRRRQRAGDGERRLRPRRWPRRPGYVSADRLALRNALCCSPMREAA
jgi:hypothetical protein